MPEPRYSKWTVEGERKTEWICGCFQTSDDFFKFCERHNEVMKAAIKGRVDELDMTRVAPDGGGS